MNFETKCRCGKKGTIVYIGGFELPDKNAAAHRVMNNAKLFKLLGYETVFVGVDKSESATKDILNSKKIFQGFDCYAVRYPKSVKEWFLYINGISKYEQVADGVTDLIAIVCYNFPAFAMDKIRNYCRKNGCLCLADITEWYGGGNRSLPLRIIKDIESHHRMYYSHKKMDGLIVISRYLESFYEGNNVLRLPPLTDLSEEKWKNGKEKEIDNLRICYVGFPGSKDKIDLLIKSTTEVSRNYKLDIIGISKEDYLKNHPEDKLLLNTKQIEFHGKLSHISALEYVKAANYSCFFRDKDRVTMAGFPTKFSEAISSGTPVITNDSSDIDDYIKQGENGILIEELSPFNIGKCINNLENNIRVNRYIFDYRQYVELVNVWLDNLIRLKGKSNA